MKVVIFAGGMGTRIVEESHLTPKPMIEIGEHPILWHIMKIYESQGFNEFIVCLGYKSRIVKDFFLNYHYYNSDLTVDLENNNIELHRRNANHFKVTLVETGLNTNTAGRLKRVEEYLNGEMFFLTYGDGLADIDLQKLLQFHHQHGKVGTITAVQPQGRFGLLNLNQKTGEVSDFEEKPLGDGSWTNGGFFVFNPEVFKYLPDNADDYMLERLLLPRLSKDAQLMAYRHHGFWKCMDAMRDKMELDAIWNSGRVPWKLWS